MKKIVIALICAITIFGIFLLNYPKLRRPLNGEILFNLTQSLRSKYHLEPYIKSEFLCQIAQKRLLVVEKKFSHDGFYYKYFCDDCYLGENLAEGYDTEIQVVTAWELSQTHLENLLAAFTHSCLKTDGFFVVQIFGYY